MRQASHCVPVGRTRFCSANVQPEGQIGPAVLTAGNVLAVLCVLFGISFTTFVPASLGERNWQLVFLWLDTGGWILRRRPYLGLSVGARQRAL